MIGKQPELLLHAKELVEVKPVCPEYGGKQPIFYLFVSFVMFTKHLSPTLESWVTLVTYFDELSAVS